MKSTPGVQVAEEALRDRLEHDRSSVALFEAIAVRTNPGFHCSARSAIIALRTNPEFNLHDHTPTDRKYQIFLENAGFSRVRAAVCE